MNMYVHISVPNEDSRITNDSHSKVVDKTLVEWVLPDFTTTTANDATICSVLLMATLKA